MDVVRIALPLLAYFAVMWAGSMAAGRAAGLVPGKQCLDWKLDDPAGQGVEAVRPIRDEIERRTRGLLADLGTETA